MKGWLWVQLPPTERLALADMAFRLGKRDEELLAEIVREALFQELLKQRGLHRPGLAYQEVCNDQQSK